MPPPDQMKHTPEPWKTDGWDLWHFGAGYNDPRDPHLFTGITTHKGCQTPEAEANLRRIVACVNLLARHPSLPSVVTLSGEEVAKVRLALEMCGGCDEGHCGICGHKEGNHADSCEVLCAINAITPTKG